MRRFFMLFLVLLLVALVGLPTAIGRLIGKRVPEPLVKVRDGLMVTVYFPDRNQTEEMVLEEYLKGVVAAEMPADFGMEALKAQFVVARTYAVKRMQRFSGPQKGGCPLHPKSDVCADPATSQGYQSKGQMEKRLGVFSTASLWRRLEQAQTETTGLVLTYRGELTDPLYHSVSGTATEDSGEYFHQSLPYLKSVDDHWGVYAPKLVETRRVPVESVAKAFSVNTQKPVTILSRTGTGRVKQVRVGDAIYTGREFRERLGLRSANFTIAVQGKELVIQTTGYGHGVGMSQYGANGMAKAGKNFKEILQHYYPGTQISPIFSE